MKNSYNPYTVPQNFFEDSCIQALSTYRKRVRAIKCGIAAICAAAVIILVPVFVKSINTTVSDKEITANNLASMYEYDIFLQVNF